MKHTKIFFSLLLLWISLAALGYIFMTTIQEKMFEFQYNNSQYWELIKNEATSTPEGLHNMWNAWYRYFQSTRNLEDAKKSLNYYSSSLEIEENEDTRFNYEFLKKILDGWDSENSEEQDSEEQASEDAMQDEWEAWSQDSEKTEDNETNDTSEDESQAPEESSQSSQNVQVSPRESQYYLNKQDRIEPLSPTERQAIESAIDRLKQEQLYNQKYFNPSESTNPVDDMFESFFWENPFFQSEIQSEEKDW